ncbi:MAG: D-aminoacyl-tRNA deacylase [Myxococcota bacterium]
MRSVVQRVSRASVTVEETVVGAIERGVLVFVGVVEGDTEADAVATAKKIAGLRIFPSEHKAMDRALADVGGACLVVSQFTLAGVVTKGRRPSFDKAEDPALAAPLVERVVAELQALGLEVATGRFGASMRVELVNDGPATLLVFTRDGVVVSV